MRLATPPTPRFSGGSSLSHTPIHPRRRAARSLAACTPTSRLHARRRLAAAQGEEHVLVRYKDAPPPPPPLPPEPNCKGISGIGGASSAPIAINGNGKSPRSAPMEDEDEGQFTMSRSWDDIEGARSILNLNSPNGFHPAVNAGPAPSSFLLPAAAAAASAGSCCSQSARQDSSPLLARFTRARARAAFTPPFVAWLAGLRPRLAATSCTPGAAHRRRSTSLRSRRRAPRREGVTHAPVHSSPRPAALRTLVSGGSMPFRRVVAAARTPLPHSLSALPAPRSPIVCLLTSVCLLSWLPRPRTWRARTWTALCGAPIMVSRGFACCVFIEMRGGHEMVCREATDRRGRARHTHICSSPSNYGVIMESPCASSPV